MFSWKKKKEPKRNPRSKEKTNNPFDEFGIGGTNQKCDDDELEAELRAITGVHSALDTPEIGDEDEDIEAELLRITGTKSKKTGKKREERKVQSGSKKEPPVGNINEILNMNVEEDADVDVDENDTELLDELLELTQPEEEEPESESSSEAEEAPKEEPNVLQVLTERLEMYKTAEKKAKENKESSRARRFTRGIKTIEDLLKKAKAGEPVLTVDIPPLIALNLKPVSVVTEVEKPDLPPSSNTDQLSDRQSGAKMSDGLDRVKANDLPDRADMSGLGNEEKTSDREKESPKKTDHPRVEDSSEGKTKLRPGEDTPKTKEVKTERYEPVDETEGTKPELPKKPIKPEDKELKSVPDNIDKSLISLLQARRDKYKLGAIKAKKNNDLQAALEYVKIVKQLNALITAAENGEIINKEQIPGSIPSSPVKPSLPSPSSPVKTSPDSSRPSFTSPGFPAESSPDSSGTSLPFPSSSTTPVVVKTPKTVLEALEQRLKVFSDLQMKSEKQGDKVGAQKNGKIVQIYKHAISMHQAGKNVPFERLPTTPMCASIPLTFQVPSK